MYLSQTDIKALRYKVENEGGFQVAILPLQPSTYLNVKVASDHLYQQLVNAGYEVLVDDRGQKPKNMFEVIEFLGVQHRVVISGRSISAGVFEYKNLQTDEFCKIPEKDMFSFLIEKIKA